MARPSLSSSEVSSLVADGVTTIKGYPKVKIHTLGVFSWQYVYKDCEVECCYPIGRLVSFQRVSQRTGESWTFFLKICVFLEELEFVVYDSEGSYIHHTSKASTVISEVLQRTTKTSSKTSGRYLLLLDLTDARVAAAHVKRLTSFNFIREDDNMEIFEVDIVRDSSERNELDTNHARAEPARLLAKDSYSPTSYASETSRQLNIELHNLDEMEVSDPENYQQSGVSEDEDHEYSDLTAIGDNEEDQVGDLLARPEPLLAQQDRAVHELKTAFSRVPDSVLREAIQSGESKKTRIWSITKRVALLTEIQRFSPLTKAIPTVINDHRPLFQHLVKFIRDDLGMVGVNENAIKCQLDKLKRTYGDDVTIACVLEAEIAQIVQRTSFELKEDEAAMKRVEDILTKCSEGEKNAIMRRLHSQCALATPGSKRFSSYCSLDDLLDQAEAAPAHESEQDTKKHMLVQKMRFVIEQLLELNSPESADIVDRPWFWMTFSTLFRVRNGESPTFSQDELDFYTSLYNLCGAASINLLRGTECFNVCTPSPATLRRHNAKEAEKEGSRDFGPNYEVIRDCVKKVLSSGPGHILGLKFDETDLTREKGADGDVNFSIDVRETTNWFSSFVKSKSRITVPKALKWFELSKARLEGKKEEIEVQMKNKKNQAANAQTSGAKLKVIAKELEKKFSEVDS